jgi:hypothetical protein
MFSDHMSGVVFVDLEFRHGPSAVKSWRNTEKIASARVNMWRQR